MFRTITSGIALAAALSLGGGSGWVTLSLRVPQLSHWSLPQLFDEPDADAAAPESHTALREVLSLCVATARDVSDEISASYFTHSSELKQSLGIQ